MKNTQEFFQLGVTKPSKSDIQNYLDGLGTRLMQLPDIKNKIIKHFKNIKNLQLDPAGRKILSFEGVEMEEGKFTPKMIDKLKKDYEKLRGKRLSLGKNVELEKIVRQLAKDKEALVQLVKADIPFISMNARLILNKDHGVPLNKYEGVEMEENSTEIEDLGEALSPSQRRKMGIRMRILAKKPAFIMKRKRMMKRAANKDTLLRRARKAAIKMVVKKFYPKLRGKKTSDLSYAERGKISDIVKKKAAIITRFAKRMVKDVRKKDVERRKNMNKQKDKK